MALLALNFLRGFDSVTMAAAMAEMELIVEAAVNFEMDTVMHLPCSPSIDSAGLMAHLKFIDTLMRYHCCTSNYN